MNGYSASLTIGGESIEVESGAEAIELPLGPLIARGTLEEWGSVIGREASEIAPTDELPNLPEPAAWSGTRRPFPIADSE